MDIYAENILEHYKNPRNQGSIDKPDASFTERNPLCGDIVKVDLKLKDGQIEDLKFSGEGCAISQATISILSEKLIGTNIADLDQIDRKHITEMLGIPISERRIKCALLCLLALKNAVNQHLGAGESKWKDVL